MIRRTADFMIAPCETIESLVGLRQVKEFFYEKNQDCFPVIEDRQVVGILTWQDIMKAHINRIVADAMSGRFAYAEPDMPLWRAKEILEHNNLAALLVREQGVLSGLVTPAIIKQELGKHTDLLTGLYKTDYLYYHALRMMASSQQVAIIFVDIDKFGEINKQYGHIKGDLILKAFSILLQTHMPQEARLCRFGGDEFVILMSCSHEAVVAFAQKLGQTVARYTFVDDIPVTMSAGVAAIGGLSNQSVSHSHLLASLINKASLASTSAKKDKCGIKALKQMIAGESA